MKSVAVIPMKLNNQGLPQKNMKCFTNGNPLCFYILSTFLKFENWINGGIYVYCSNPEIQHCIPKEIFYLKHSEEFN